MEQTFTSTETMTRLCNKYMITRVHQPLEYRSKRGLIEQDTCIELQQTSEFSDELHSNACYSTASPVARYMVRSFSKRTSIIVHSLAT